MDELEPVRSVRPIVPEPSAEVVATAKATLFRAIQAEREGMTSGVVDQLSAVRSRRSKAARYQRPFAVAAALLVAASVAFGVVALQSPTKVKTVAARPLDGTSSPAKVLNQAADLVLADYRTPQSGSIRHTQFRNLTDAGHPVYDLYVRPNGTAMVGQVGAKLTATDGYLTAAQIASLPSNPTALRKRMLTLAAQLGLGYAGESPERSLVRLAGELLPDPGVPDVVEAGIYRVLAAINSPAVQVRTIGNDTDAQGRTGVIIQFTYEEGVIDRVVLDRTTGRLLSTTSTLPDGSQLGGQVYLRQELVSAIPSAS